MKIQPDVKGSWEKEEDPMLEDALIESYIGFSKVFKLLVTLKKPMVGHNTLLDLMFMYQQFYKPLPRMYNYIQMKKRLLVFSIFILFSMHDEQVLNCNK